jgi:hypothetical protein
MAPTRPCDSHRNCVSRRTSKKSGSANKEMGCSLRPSNLTGHRSLRCGRTHQMISWRTVTIRPRSHATHCDGVHAGYDLAQQRPVGRNLPSWSRRTWNDLRFSTGPTKLPATMHRFAQSWSGLASRSGTWIFLLRRTRYLSEWFWSRITSSIFRAFPVSRWESGVDLCSRQLEGRNWGRPYWVGFQAL